MSSTRSKKTDWFFTCYELGDKDGFIESEEFAYVIVSGTAPCPTTGRLHYHGFFQLKKRNRITWLKSNVHDKASFKAGYPEEGDPEGKIDKEAIDRYIDKHGVRHGEHGTYIPTKQGARKDLAQIKEIVLGTKQDINEIIKEHCDNYQQIQFARALATCRGTRRKKGTFPVVKWFWGPTNTGKSRAAWDLFDDWDDVWESNYEGGQWFDGYGGQQLVILEEFTTDFCSFKQILRLTDRYPMRVPIKSSRVQWNPAVIVIIASKPPSEIFIETTAEKLDQLTRRITETTHFNEPIKDVN